MVKYISVLLFGLLLSGCSSQFTSDTLVNDVAYVQLSGNFIGGQMLVDNDQLIHLEKSNIETFNYKGNLVAKFPIDVGSHEIQITKGNQVLAHRKIYVTNGQTFEIAVL